MSYTGMQADVRLERVPEIDDGTLLRIRQVRPVEKTASPIIDHNLELIDLANGLKKWYQGKGVSTPHDLLGDLLDPNENSACDKLNAFVGTVKRFKPGAFPAHCDAVRELEFSTVRLIRTLMEITDAPIFVEALKRVGALFATLGDPINFTLSDHDFQQRLNSRLANLIESFAEISSLFKKRERERDFEIVFRKLPPEPATKEDVRAIVSTAADSAADKIVSATEKTEKKVDEALEIERQTAATVRRIDRRAAKDKQHKRDKETERLHRVYEIWEEGQSSETVKNSTNGKVSYADVFEKYMEKLLKLGVKHAGAFEHDIIKVNKRKSKGSWR